MLTWNVDPIMVSFGKISIHWYGALFGLAFILGFRAMQAIFIRENVSLEKLDSLFLYIFAGTLIGARLGHCLFYEPGIYLNDPIRIFYIWEGGLASHGGTLGVFIAIFLFCRRNPELKYLWVCDRMVFPSMITSVLVRIGNFFNSEIIGHPTQVPWAVIFARVDQAPRHPAQLYESLSYFIILLILLWLYLKKNAGQYRGALVGTLLILVFGARFFIEWVKENQVEFEGNLFLNMGQILSLPTIAIGVFLVVRSGFFGKSKA